MTIFSDSINKHFPEDWLLHFVADDQSEQLKLLIDDLMRPFSDCGDGKRFESGLAYWGIGPTIAWQRACSDPFYPVAQASTQGFSRSLQNMFADCRHLPLNYVSFGIGTGEKDSKVLKYLLRIRSDLHFIPIDMSASMLSLGLREIVKNVQIKHGMLLPIQMDFSVQWKIDSLRRMVEKVVGEEPVMYSCLGNTVANFDRDDLLFKVFASILRVQDRLLLEVAMTNEVNADIGHKAADEYSGSNDFGRFVTSALLRNTDLPIIDGSVSLKGRVDEIGDAVRVQAIYTCVEDRNLAFTVPDQQKVDFRRGDTIRLYLSRKYSPTGIKRLLKEAGLREVSYFQYDVGDPRPGAGKFFGIRLMLVEPSAAKVFVSYGHNDENFVRTLASSIREAGMTTWVADQSLEGGGPIMSEVTKAIKDCEKVVVVLSPESIHREWVKTEIRLAYQASRRNGSRKLYAVTLMDPSQLDGWTVLDENGNLANDIRENYIFNFANCAGIPEQSHDWARFKAALIAPSSQQ